MHIAELPIEAESLDGVHARGGADAIHGRAADPYLMLTRMRAMKPTRLPALLLALLVLAGAPVLAIATGAVKDGAYSGSVGPGWPLSFRVAAHGTKVEDLVAGFDAGCNGAPGEVAPLFHFPTLELRDGKLSGSTSRTFASSTTDVLHISARFSGDELSGKITVDQTIKSLGTCSEPATVTAKLK